MRFLKQPIAVLLPTVTLFVINNLLLLLGTTTQEVTCQEPAFELPVQLIGFPVIILAVRFSNFVKKLAYSLNPQTYSSNIGASNQQQQTYQKGISLNTIQRSKRSTLDDLRQDFEVNFDIDQAERKLVDSLGENVCVMQRVCVQHAVKSLERNARMTTESSDSKLEKLAKNLGMLGAQPDWEEILNGYLSSSNEDKQWYLLSVFIGDVMKNPDFCRKLSKRRPCQLEIEHQI